MSVSGEAKAFLKTAQDPVVQQFFHIIGNVESKEGEMELNEDTSRLRLIIGWIVDVAVVISIAWFAVFSLGTQITASGQSMEPVIAQNDTVLMNRLVYRIKKPQRYEIVVFEKKKGEFNIKRVVGLPGETIQIRDNLLYINGKPAEGPENLKTAALAGLAEHPVVLGEDEYFLLGDNRENSDDSRFANVGNVKKRQIKGKVWLRIQPLKRFGLIRS